MFSEQKKAFERQQVAEIVEKLVRLIPNDKIKIKRLPSSTGLEICIGDKSLTIQPISPRDIAVNFRYHGNFVCYYSSEELATSEKANLIRLYEQVYDIGYDTEGELRKLLETLETL